MFSSYIIYLHTLRTPLDLHSFPTRRSSDLARLGLPAAEQAVPRAGQLPEPVRGTRSEEHTSELQSRGHLVCRLLLEKKNKKVNQYNSIIYIINICYIIYYTYYIHLHIIKHT